MPCREVARVAWQVQVETLDHVTPRDEEQKRFARRPSLHLDEGVDGIAVDGAAESIDGLSWIGEYTAHFHVRQREPRRRIHFLWGPERNR
jgi:hypothetical protein